MPIRRNGLGKGLDSLIPDKNSKSGKNESKSDKVLKKEMNYSEEEKKPNNINPEQKDHQKRDAEIEEEKRKWNKGLRKIKKRTFHYFSDETFDFLVDNYRQKMNIRSVDFAWLNDEIKPYVEILQVIEELLS